MRARRLQSVPAFSRRRHRARPAHRFLSRYRRELEPVLCGTPVATDPVPDNVSDENAVLVEPFAVALHAVLRNRPKDDDTALIIGSGVVGLCTVAALRAIGSKARIIITARHPFQQEMAKRLGADIVVAPERGAAFYRQIAELTGASVLKPIVGKEVVSGGAEIVYECVGSSRTVDDALRLTAPSGTMVLVGLAGAPSGVDWTPIWLTEVAIRG